MRERCNSTGPCRGKIFLTGSSGRARGEGALKKGGKVEREGREGDDGQHWPSWLLCAWPADLNRPWLPTKGGCLNRNPKSQ